MYPRFLLVILAGLYLVPNVNGQSPAPPRTDALGDALPTGAIARLGTLRFKHEAAQGASITNAMFSPDGKLILSMAGRGSGSIRLWDAVSGKQLTGPWEAAGKVYSAVAFSPDGKVLATADELGNNERRSETVLWEIATAKRLQTLGKTPDAVQSMVFADGGKTLITAGNGTVTWWDVAKGKQGRVWQALAEVEKQAKGKAALTPASLQCRLSPDGKFMVVERGSVNGFNRFNIDVDGLPYLDVSSDSEVIGFDLASGKMQWKSKPANSAKTAWVAFSADSKRVAFMESAEKLALRDIANGKLVAMAELPVTKGMATNNEALLLARIRLIELQGGAFSNVPNAALAVSPDGTTVAICGADGRVSVWKQEESGTLRKMNSQPTKAGSASASAVAFSPDGRRLLIGAGSILKVYDVATLSEAVPLDGHEREVAFVAYSADGKRLFTSASLAASNTSDFLSWDTASWKLVSGAGERPADLPAKGMASPDNSVYLGINGDNRFGLYDPANGKQLAGLSMPTNQNLQARAYFSPDSKYVVVPGKDGQGKDIQRLYRVPSGKLVCELPPLGQPVETLRPMAFSADGRLVALFSRGDGLIHVFELATGKLCHRLGTALPGPQRNFFSNLAFCASGKLLASWTAADNVVRIWDMQSGKALQELPFDGELHNRLNMAWSPDGRMLALGDRKIQIWELATRRIRREFSGHEGDIRALAFSPDGRLLASGSVDTTALVWDVWGR